MAWGSSVAVEVAFEALPFMIKTLGEQRRFLREPLGSVVRLIGAGRDWLRDSCQRQRHCVYILSGDRGSGKTRLLTAIAETLLMSGKKVGGILSPVVQSQDSRLGYDVLDLQSGRQVPLCRRDIEPTGGSTGPFRFDAEAILSGTPRWNRPPPRGRTWSFSTRSGRSNSTEEDGQRDSNVFWRPTTGRCCSWCVPACSAA